MKNKIFEKMRAYGWNLSDNTNEDFGSVYNIHYRTIQDLYDLLHLLGDYENGYKDETCIDLNDIDQQRLTDLVDFMSDFLRALNEVNDNIDIRPMNNLEKALIDEINMNLTCEYEDKLKVEECDKLKISQEIIDKENTLWEDLNNIINDKLDDYKAERIEKLKKEISYHQEKLKCCGYGKREIYELADLENELEELESL